MKKTDLRISDSRCHLDLGTHGGRHHQADGIECLGMPRERGALASHPIARLVHRTPTLIAVILLSALALIGCKAKSQERPAPGSSSAGQPADDDGSGAGTDSEGGAGGAEGGTAGSVAAAGGPATAGSPGAAGSLATAGSPGAAEAGAAAIMDGGDGGSAGRASASAGGTMTVSVGQECTSDAGCETSDLCASDPGAVTAVCRPRCLASEVGERGACGDGAVCAFDETLVRASCHATCSLEANGILGCVSPDGCRIAPDSAVVGGESVAGLCVRLGTLLEGARCVEGECSEGLECVTRSSGSGFCAPHCDPSVSPDELGGCADGLSCVEGTSGRAGCISICSALADGVCPDGQACVLDGGAEPFEGRCATAGTLQVGDDCAPGQCAPGLLCSPAPTPFAGVEFTCEPICDVSDGSRCAEFEACVQVPIQPAGVGTCRESCILLIEGTEGGCAEGQWCAPATEAVGIGICVQTQGGGTAGTECVTSRDCDAGLYCDCAFGADSSCEGTATCKPICLSESTADEPGACPPDQSCAFETSGGILYAFGTCGEACDFDAGDTCAAGEETCSAAPYAAASSGVCQDIPQPHLTIGEPCLTPQFGIHEVCAPSGICEFDEARGLVACAQICRVAAGALGSTAHPDCSDSTATCSEILPELSYGYCSR